MRRRFWIILLVSGALFRPDTAVASDQAHKHSISLSTDTLTWAIDGYSVIGSYEHSAYPKLRFHAEVFGIKLPESIIDSYEPNQGEGWQRRIDGAFMLSVDHHPLPRLKGLHWGAGFNVQRSTVSRTGFASFQEYDTFEPIVRVGYQWFPLGSAGLFITPYAVLGFPIHLSEPDAVGGEVYEEAAVLPVASVQLGWRFPM